MKHFLAEGTILKGVCHDPKRTDHSKDALIEMFEWYCTLRLLFVTMLTNGIYHFS